MTNEFGFAPAFAQLGKRRYLQSFEAEGEEVVALHFNWAAETRQSAEWVRAVQPS